MSRAEMVVILNSGDASVSLIDKATYQVVETYPIGKEPHHLLATPDNKSLLVANAAANELVVLDPVTGKLQRRIPGIDDPYKIGFSPDQKWFVTAGNRVDIYAYDGKDMKIRKQVPMPQTPGHLALTGDSKIVFVTLQDSDELSAIDLNTQTQLWKIKVGSAPSGVWMTPDEKYLLVGMTGADCMAVIDWRTRTLVKSIPTGKGARNFRALGDKRNVLISNRISATISIIGQQKLEKTGDITGLCAGPDDMELTADGKELWITCRWAKTVAVVDMATRKVTRRIRVGKSPYGVYFQTRAPLN
ncbi:MAG: YncE family protein [Candidatus Protistobacter heckmanni]|nr:YncE family protein [Candidatus Protistobacter heckmanni]